MNKEKFVLLSIEGETNIGVVQCGEFDLAHKDAEVDIKRVIEPKMVQALAGHFDYEIKVRSIVVKSLFPITLEAQVVVCAEEEDRVETVEITEIWVY